MWGILIALLSGALMSIQGVFNTEVTRQSSIWVSAGWVQLTAFVTCLVMWLFTILPKSFSKYKHYFWKIIIPITAVNAPIAFFHSQPLFSTPKSPNTSIP